MIILGIDPGIAIVGFGVIENQGSKNIPLDFGVIRTPQTESTPVRLRMIADSMDELLDTYKPDCVAIEELFYANNQKTVINVAQARGVILSQVVNKCGRIYEYTPLQIKQAITGYGKADKRQVQEMVRALLKLKSIPKPDDAADGLAVALTCAQTLKMGSLYSV